MAFSWDRVPRKYRQLLLKHGLQYTRSADRVAKVGTIGDTELTSWCDQIFHTPPHPVWFQSDRLWRVFLEQWLPNAPSPKVELLYLDIANHRRDPTRCRTKRTQVDYLQGLRNSVYLRKEVRGTFLSCYQEPKKRKTPVKRSQYEFRHELEGKGSTARPGWPHQEEAWRELDDCRLDGPVPTRGLIVFPTGAGKTFTVAKWLTSRWLHAHDDTRVLWLAHREELLSQAYVAFAESIAEESDDFRVSTSVVGSFAAHYKRLGDPELRLAIVSVPSLGRSFDRGKENIVKAFTSWPTVLVVDEAHHAGAATYQDLIKYALDNGDIRLLLGLTATPRPTGLRSRHKFFELFPKEPLAKADIDRLTDEGILARPEIHVVDTFESISLANDEIERTEQKGELPDEVLDRLITEHRGRVVIEEYVASQATYGKTLVFAINRRHADQLGELFKDVVPTRVLHGASDEDRVEVLQWFTKDEGPKVLINVEMLIEGIDVPSAGTVILARPTVSYILLRQMIGRVLRGERAGGPPVAHIVYLRDQWENFSDVLDPAEIIDEPMNRHDGTRAQHLPEIRDASTGDPLPTAVIAAAERIYRDLELRMHVARNGLAGYYVLDERRFPVFAHQSQAFEKLIDEATGDLRGRPLLSFFEHTPDPAPSSLALRQLVDFVKEEGPPEFVAFRDDTTPTAVARVLLDVEQTERSCRDFIRSRWESSAARLVYPEFGQFEEVVTEEIERLRAPEGNHRGINHDFGLIETNEQKKGMIPFVQRDDLPQLQEDVIEWIRSHLPHIAPRAEPVPRIKWTPNVVGDWLANWTFKRTGQDKGPRISLNLLLSTQKRIVSDDMLRYLIYHEVLHHLLPLHGHDRLFRLLEARWPNAVELDARFEALEDHWELRPKRYRRSKGI
jgi:superfamily II DNA or RNA helicase